VEVCLAKPSIEKGPVMRWTRSPATGKLSPLVSCFAFHLSCLWPPLPEKFSDMNNSSDSTELNLLQRSRFKGGIVALSVERRTCDQEVVGSSLGHAIASGVKTLGKFLTSMWLCLCHISWYWPNGGDA